jgi:hypothetical protein
MPTYEYFCPSNGVTLEVNHSIKETLTNWGEVCDRAQADPGSTPRTATVRRLISGGQFISSNGKASGGHGCGGGTCGCAH